MIGMPPNRRPAIRSSASFNLCSVCLSVCYRSPEHQSLDWAAHNTLRMQSPSCRTIHPPASGITPASGTTFVPGTTPARVLLLTSVHLLGHFHPPPPVVALRWLPPPSSSSRLSPSPSQPAPPPPSRAPTVRLAAPAGHASGAPVPTPGSELTRAVSRSHPECSVARCLLRQRDGGVHHLRARPGGAGVLLPRRGGAAQRVRGRRRGVPRAGPHRPPRPSARPAVRARLPQLRQPDVQRVHGLVAAGECICHIKLDDAPPCRPRRGAAAPLLAHRRESLDGGPPAERHCQCGPAAGDGGAQATHQRGVLRSECLRGGGVGAGRACRRRGGVVGAWAQNEESSLSLCSHLACYEVHRSQNDSSNRTGLLAHRATTAAVSALAKNRFCQPTVKTQNNQMQRLQL